MAAAAAISLRAKLVDLGVPLEIIRKFSIAPDYTTYQYMVQTTADTEQVLNLGKVTTVQAIIIIAKTNDLAIDTSFDTTFSEELTVSEGEWVMFKPAGTVYIKNHTADEVATFEYVVLGE